MKQSLIIGFILFSISLFATDYPTANTAQMPEASIQSVNNPSYLSSGSTFSSEVYEVGSGAPSRTSARKAPPSGTGTVVNPNDPNYYDPNNPQFAPLGDGLLPLLLFVLLATLNIMLKLLLTRKKTNKKAALQ